MDVKSLMRAEADVTPEYDRGRRDMLNALLACNPDVAKMLHAIRCDDGNPFENEHGKLPFDVVFWVTAVADQFGIAPKEEG